MLSGLCSKGHAPFDTNPSYCWPCQISQVHRKFDDKLIMMALDIDIFLYANGNLIFYKYQIHLPTWELLECGKLKKKIHSFRTISDTRVGPSLPTRCGQEMSGQRFK
jgi:hypothetical protein